MGFSRQCWSGLPSPTPGDLPDPGMDLCCLRHWQFCLHWVPQLVSSLQTKSKGWRSSWSLRWPAPLYLRLVAGGTHPGAKALVCREGWCSSLDGGQNDASLGQTSCLHHFLRVRIQEISYSICLSPPDSLHSVRQSLGPSLSLQVAWFHSFYGRVILWCLAEHSLKLLQWWKEQKSMRDPCSLSGSRLPKEELSDLFT